MRRFPFFVAPLLGIVALFFLFKLLFTALLGLAVFGAAFLAVRRLAGHRHSPMHVAAMRRHQPVPIDPGQHGQAFDWMPQNRIVEII